MNTSSAFEDVAAYDYVNADSEMIAVVNIDTADNPGRVRVYLNDGLIYDGNPETDAHGVPADVLAVARRSTTPQTIETPEEVAERVLHAESGADIRAIVVAAVHAGIQAAWESWEPDEHGGDE